MRGNVLGERLDGALRMAAAEPVRSDLQPRPAQAEPRIGAVQLAQEQLPFLHPAGPQASDAQRVQRGEVVRVLLRGWPQHLDGAGEASLLDEDLPQLDAGTPVVGIDRELAGGARGRLRMACATPRRKPKLYQSATA